jgi:hypothetical protein
MERELKVHGRRLAAVRRALLIMAEADGEDDGHSLHQETRRGYERVLEIAEDAGLLTAAEHVTLRDVADGWARQPPVARALLASFVSEVLEAARGPGLTALAQWLRTEPPSNPRSPEDRW